MMPTFYATFPLLMSLIPSFTTSCSGTEEIEGEPIAEASPIGPSTQESAHSYSRAYTLPPSDQPIDMASEIADEEDASAQASGFKNLSIQNHSQIFWVTTWALNVRAGPSLAHPVVAQLTKGDKIAIAEHQGEWVKIRSQEGEQWVAARYLRAYP